MLCHYGAPSSPDPLLGPHCSALRDWMVGNVRFSSIKSLRLLSSRGSWGLHVLAGHDDTVTAPQSHVIGEAAIEEIMLTLDENTRHSANT